MDWNWPMFTFMMQKHIKIYWLLSEEDMEPNHNFEDW